jgi:hypothetical protein
MMDVDLTFFLVIAAGVLDGVFQYFWVSTYFSVGIPIFAKTITATSVDELNRCELLTFKDARDGRILIRQKKYGIVRYAFFMDSLR